MSVNKKAFSFDAETNGLWGQAFAVAAVIYTADGLEESSISLRCPIRGKTNNWVEENVLPEMTEIPVNCSSYEEMLANFAAFYMENKDSCNIIVHMGMPVESKLFLDMHEKGYIGDWDAPYPLIDIAGNLQQAGFDPTSVDSYNESHGLKVPEMVGGTHNPLYDSIAAALCYMDLMK